MPSFCGVTFGWKVKKAYAGKIGDSLVIRDADNLLSKGECPAADPGPRYPHSFACELHHHPSKVAFISDTRQNFLNNSRNFFTFKGEVTYIKEGIGLKLL